MTAYSLVPIGVVRSPVVDPTRMPNDGVPAVVEILPAYADGLADLASNSHIWVIAWLDRAERTTLIAGTRSPEAGRRRGVFGLRSNARPNPLGLTATRLLGVDGLRLSVERLDFVDGTPVVDVKRYSPGWDTIFSAVTSRDLRAPGDDEAGFARELLHEAAFFHGETCAGAALGARLIARALRTWQTGKRDPTISVVAPPDGCLADALQAITGATFGNGRLHCPTGSPGAEFSQAVHLTRGDTSLRFKLAKQPPATADAVLAAAERDLFWVMGDEK